MCAEAALVCSRRAVLHQEIDALQACFNDQDSVTFIQHQSLLPSRSQTRPPPARWGAASVCGAQSRFPSSQGLGLAPRPRTNTSPSHTCPMPQGLMAGSCWPGRLGWGACSHAFLLPLPALGGRPPHPGLLQGLGPAARRLGTPMNLDTQQEECWCIPDLGVSDQQPPNPPGESLPAPREPGTKQKYLTSGP